MATSTRPRAAGPAEPEVQTPWTDAEPSGTTSTNSKVVFVLGGPGSGKGTQCTKIVENFGFVHLSAGDLLREEQESGSENGEMIKGMLKEGKLVPSEILVKLLVKAMEENTNNKFLIDGFPRNNENREVFEQVTGISPEFVLFFDCPEEEMVKRLLGRNQGRADDNIETIRKRFKVFTESSLPVIKYYEPSGKLHKINAAQPVDKVFAVVRPLFKRFVQEDLLQYTVDLLRGFDTGNYKTYQRYCVPEVTIFEPQAQGQLVEGVDLRNFKFNLGSATERLCLSNSLRSTIVAPKVCILSSGVGLVLYTRLLQQPGNSEMGYVEAYNETGVWQRVENNAGNLDWKLVHYHRSVAPTV